METLEEGEVMKMPFRVDPSAGLNLNHKAPAPVKLPRMSFPMIGGIPEAATPVSDTASTDDAVPFPDQNLSGSESQHLPEQEGVAMDEPLMEESGPTVLTGLDPEMAPAPQTVPAPSTVFAPQFIPPTQPAAEPQSRVSPQPARVIVYGRSNCPACLAAIQDLMNRQVSFTYYDVARDAAAAQHLTAICGGDPVIPVIVQIGFSV